MHTFHSMQRQKSGASPSHTPSLASLAHSRTMNPAPSIAHTQHGDAKSDTEQPRQPARSAYQGHALSRIAIAHSPKNATSLPGSLQAGIKRLSGLSLNDVQVHYNSFQPARVNALAYTQGKAIHVGPGQERYLAHEAWHVVQQMQGRVKPTLQAKGMKVNDDEKLEHEADVMGAKAAGAATPDNQGIPSAQSSSATTDWGGDEDTSVSQQKAADDWDDDEDTSVSQQKAADDWDDDEDTPVSQQKAADNHGGIVQMAPYRPPQRAAARRQWGDISMRGRQRTLRTTIPLDIRERGNRLRQRYRSAGGNPSGLRINNYVYIATSRGQGTYVGITNDPRGRQHGHGERFHLHILNPAQPLSRIEVRGIEQYLINLGRGSSRNQNIANSIAATQPYYAAAVAFGHAFYNWIMTQHRGNITFQV
jgi:hypothetical protein